MNNWWIVKRPNQDILAVTHPVDVIRHGDVIQLVHGITSRALNSHDVAAAMSPQNQVRPGTVTVTSNTQNRSSSPGCSTLASTGL